MISPLFILIPRWYYSFMNQAIDQFHLTNKCTAVYFSHWNIHHAYGQISGAPNDQFVVKCIIIPPLMKINVIKASSRVFQCCWENIICSFFSIVIRGDWLWKAANINDKNNSAAVYVQSTVKVHNPLFSVGKLLRNKLMQRFYWSIQSKW